jgi:Tol biopolymer transport system component
MRTACTTRNLVTALWIAATTGLATAQDQTRRLSSNAAGDPGSGDSIHATVSADGNFVAFASIADDLVPNDTNGHSDIFLFDRVAGTLERVSVATDGSEANYESYMPSLSADGRYVAFGSVATNLGGGSKIIGEIFVRDRVAGTTTCVSVDASGAPANRYSEGPSISGDGNRITFGSYATNLDPADTNGAYDVFVHDVSAGTTSLVSVTSSGVVGDAISFGALLSSDGKHVSFFSQATNFPNAPTSFGTAYVKDLDTGNLERVDVDSTGAFPAIGASPNGISNDGSIVLLVTGQALVPEDTNSKADAYVRDRTNGVTERASLATGGGQITGVAAAGMSNDGRFVGFLSVADDATFDDHNGFLDLIIHDRVLGISTLVSRGTLDERIAHYPYLEPYGSDPGRWISDDGSQIVFESDTPDLVSGDTTGLADVFLRSLDRHAATTTHYGSGWPGTGGVIPTLSPRTPPYRGAQLDVDVTNSAGASTIALVFVGFARSDVATSLGGSLLVDSTLVIPLGLADAGATLSGVLPTDYWAKGLALDLQGIELDSGASRGVSFTDGLELVLGDS